MNQQSPGSPGSGMELRSSLLRERSAFSVDHAEDVPRCSLLS